MASWIIKAKGVDLNNTSENQVTIGRFYSGDRFYTLLNEYIDKNLSRKNKFMAWIIKILFKSSNFKHDPGIANGQPLSVKLFDWFCIICLIAFIILTLGVIGTMIPVIMGVVTNKIDKGAMDTLKAALMGVGIPAICVGIPAIFWLIVFFAIRKKNKPLTLQAYVEKKVSWCLKLRFLVKNIKITKQKDKSVFVLENFEGQGAAAPRWLNIQMINLISSIFNDFNYVFRFESLTDEEVAELKPIMDYDFRMLDLINADEIKWNVWNKEPKKNIFRKTKEVEIKEDKKQQETKSSNKKESK